MAAENSARRITVFYAWQTDLPARFNRNAIKKCLRVAAAEIEERLSESSQEPIEIIIDEATRDRSGSPNIPDSIREKIESADIFVADVSIINAQNKEGRETPNPNVVFELGLAVAHLGWDRVVLLVNSVYGGVELLPFDFDRHRATSFKLSDAFRNAKDLTNILEDALALIISKDPPRPKASEFNVAEVQRGRDLTCLRWLLGAIHWPTIEEHIREGPQHLSMASDHFHEEVSAIHSTPLFHFYDDELRTRVDSFILHWDNSVKHDHYSPMIGARVYQFQWNRPLSTEKQQRDWDYMVEERREMYRAMNELLALIRERYPEIDLAELSIAAIRRYSKEMQEIEATFERAKTEAPVRRTSTAKRSSQEKRTNKARTRRRTEDRT